MNYYNKKIDEVLKELDTSNEGLTYNEANDRLNKYGKNILVNKNKNTIIIKFLNQFKDLMVLTLLIASIISFILSIINNDTFIDSIAIISIVLLNAILGLIQEEKADKAINSLNEMQKASVKVIRNNKIKIIDSENLVKGDIILLESGDKIPADARIIESNYLKVNESSLTGESIEVSKNDKVLKGEVPLHKRSCMIYSGTFVVFGKCKAVICETGENTEFGLIAKSLNNNIKEITPLQKRIDNISEILTSIILILIIIMCVIGLFKGFGTKEIFLLSISLAVAAIPEGLRAVITITLSIGIKNLANKNAIIRNMTSVETLGCTDVICSDKTGTITQNKMEMVELYYNDRIHKIDDIELDNLIFNNMILNNDSHKNENTYIGDPTETALYEYCEKFYNIEGIRENNVRIDELPFDSDRKMMSTINLDGDSIKLYTKGSFDSIINISSYIYENGEIKKLTKNKKEQLKHIEIEEANKSYRVLAYSFKIIDKKYILNPELEKNMVFLGMTMVSDMPRDDVKDSIEECKKANIKTIMITGDSLSTAVSVAKEIGILENEEEAILGNEIDKMSNTELKKNVSKYSVFARISPLTKLKIVNALKENGKTVAMTGDGVNDAPALKTADIGISMGINGSDVSKEVSDMVLTDDSFSTIVVAVKEGRRIFDNIRNVLVYLLTGNMIEIICVSIGIILGIEIFFPIQLLYINLITDSIPAIALAFEKEDESVMNRQVRKKDGTFFTPFLISKILLSSILKATIIFIIYFVNLKLYDTSIANSMAFLTLILLEITFTYSCKNLKKSVINKHLFENHYLNKSIILLIIIQISIFLTPLKNIFNISSITIPMFIYSLIISILIFLLDEIFKNLIYNKFKD